MRPLALALLALLSARVLDAADLRHADHFVKRVERFLGKRKPPKPRAKAARPAPPRAPTTGLRGIPLEKHPGQPDTFLVYQNALNKWHAFGRGLDELWKDYQLREAEYVTDYTARFGREATALASAKSVAANPGHQMVVAPVVEVLPKKKKCFLKEIFK